MNFFSIGAQMKSAKLISLPFCRPQGCRLPSFLILFVFAGTPRPNSYLTTYTSSANCELLRVDINRPRIRFKTLSRRRHVIVWDERVRERDRAGSRRHLRSSECKVARLTLSHVALSRAAAARGHSARARPRDANTSGTRALTVLPTRRTV